MAGTLYLVSLPIGNMSDITLRAIVTLRAVDHIIAEDTRNTRRVLLRYRINTPFTASYFQGVETERCTPLLEMLKCGKDLALVSDAGTPLISDPGYPLVRAAIAAGFKVVPVPGATALIAALVASGLPTDHFTFDGTLSRKEGERLRYLESIANETRTVIVHSSPHRLLDDLEAIAAVLPDRRLVLAREITKVHEEYLRGTAREIILTLSKRDQIRGECIMLIGGTTRKEETSDQRLTNELALLLKKEGIPTRAAMHILMCATGISRNDAYRILLSG